MDWLKNGLIVNRAASPGKRYLPARTDLPGNRRPAAPRRKKFAVQVEMVYTNCMLSWRREQRGQALVEAAVAIPIVFMLFAGCVQLFQIGLAHILVMDAAYEAGRQAALDSGDTGNAGRVAAEICRAASSGATEFIVEGSAFKVTHHLRAILPLLKNVSITHRCPAFLFKAGAEEPD